MYMPNTERCDTIKTMGELSCPVCATEVEQGNYLQRYTSDWNKKEYKLYHCPNCHLEWWEPLKIEPEFYEEEGDEGYAVFHLGIADALGENHKTFFKYFPLKSGRLLDVGCGDGRFLKKAQEAGFEVWGIDFDRKSVQVCREKRGLKNVYAMSLEEFSEFAEKEGLKFDVITFFEVLEHQDRPREFLEGVKRLLKPGGYIAGSVPNRESFITEINGRRLCKWDFPPNHFLRFSKHSLLNLLQSTFSHSVVFPIKLSLYEYIDMIVILIFGKHVVKKLRISLSGSELGELSSNFNSQPTFRKFLFKFLKLSKNAFLYPVAYLLHETTEPFLFFKAQNTEI